MIRFFAGHPTAANLLMLLLLAMGALALPGLRRETFPTFSVDQVTVTVRQPGATPEEVEEALCRRIEDAVDGIAGISEVRSEAQQGLGRVTLEAVEGTDMTLFLSDVKTEVDAIDDFPEEAEAAVVELTRVEEIVARLMVVGPMSRVDRKTYCEDLKRRLQLDGDIQVVEVEGFSDHQLRVELYHDRLLRHGLSAADVADLLRAHSVDVTAGTLEADDLSLVLRVTEQRRTPRELEALVIQSRPRGGLVRLEDLGHVVDRFELDEDKALFRGQEAGVVTVKKTEQQDIIRVAAAVERFLERERERVPPGIEILVSQDGSRIVKERLDLLVTNGWQGLLLVFLTMWLFFSLRYSLWVAAGLPVAFMGALFLLPPLGLTINMMTMVGLLLALGLLMDDAIVIAENVASHIARGKTALEAARDGTAEVGGGVVSSFLTTIAIFGPLMFIEGQIGKVLRVIPAILILVLAVSMIEAFLILPAHLAHSLAHRGSSRTHPFRRRFDAAFDWVREHVLGRAVDAFVGHRYLGVGCVVGAFALCLSLLAGGTVRFKAFPEVEGDVVVARVLLPPGTSLARTEGAVERLVAALGRVDRELAPRQPSGRDLVQEVTVQFNVNSDAKEAGPHLATITVDLLRTQERDASIDEILASWRRHTGAIPDVIGLTFAEPALGPAGSPIEVRVQGDDLARIDAAARDVVAWYARFEGVADLQSDLRPGKVEVRARLREAALALGLDASSVGRQLRASFQGVTAEQLQIGPESYEVDVRLAASERDGLQDLESFHVIDGQGRGVPLTSVADTRIERGWSRIARVNGQRTVTVTGNVDPAAANSAELNARLQREALPELRTRHPGVSFSLDGEAKEASTTQRSMGSAFLVGLLGVFFILSFEFRSYLEPIVVMFAIPFALMGVIVGHWVMGLDVSMPSMLGFVSLAGVVVNDSILLVEFIKRRSASGEVAEASRAAARARFRAVFLTSATTIAGLTPLLFETSVQAQVLIPLACSIVFGMAASTLLVLLVVPSLYTILADLGLTSARAAGHAGEHERPSPALSAS